MKKLLLFLLLVTPAFGQTFSGYSGADTFVLPPWRLCMGDDPGAHNACFTQSTIFDKTAYLRGQLDYEFTTTTISKLPSASAIYNTGRTYWISDGQSASDCSTGNGASFVLCVSNGTIWVPIGGGGGGGSSQPFLLRTNSPNCTTQGQLVQYDTANLDANGVATVENASLSSKAVIGVVTSGAGCSGIATIGTYLSAQCITDDTSVPGDLITTSSSNAGQCDDYGASVSGTVQTVGRVSKANSGAGTASQVDFFLGDLTGPGSSGSGTISPCGSNNCDTYYPLANVANVAGDPNATDDGSGNKTAKSLGLTGSGAGNFYLTQGAAPSVSVANSIYFYAPVSVTSYAWVLPGTAASGCLQASNSSGLVTISFTGSNCGSGSGSVTSVGLSINSSSSSGPFAVTGSPVTTSGTLNLNATLQGTDTKLLTSGTVSGTGATLCTDANGGATTSGCTGGGGGAPSYIKLAGCSPDTSGNVFWTAEALTNWRFQHWEWNFSAAFGGTDVILYCYAKIPHTLPTGTAKIILDFASADSTASHTMTFKECDNIITTGTIDVGSLTCTSTQNYSSTSTANQIDTLSFTVQSTIALDNMLVVAIHATAESSLANNVVLAEGHLEWQ